jgi:hypothetical protein
MRCTSEQPGGKAAPHFRRILALLPASQAQLEAPIKMLPLYYDLPCTHLIGQLPLNMKLQGANFLLLVQVILKPQL